MNNTSKFNAILFLASCLLVGNSFANPQGGVVTGGGASISSPNANTVQINQTTNNAVIDWQSYNVGRQEHVNYIQPNKGSITLNRINSQNGASQIYGSITANGQVWLVNGAGVWFGPSAHVDVSGLLVTTADITNHDFMNANYHFVQAADSSGAITNQGKIVIRNAGLAAFVAASVSNQGQIIANLGTVVLGASREYTVDFSGDQLVNFAVNDNITSHPGAHAIDNSGMILAQGGKVLLTAHVASQLLDNAINVSGVIMTNSVKASHGEIILSSNGNINVSGKLIAAGRKAGTSGGNVAVHGLNNLLDNNAVIDVSGNAGGGTVVIGDLSQALTTTINTGAKIHADALLSGNGGNIETSGHVLNIGDAIITTTALNGKAGIWLLDPADITISSSADSNITGATPFQPSTQSSNSTLSITTLLNALNAGNVVVQTSAGAGPGNGDIFVTTPISWSSSNSLTLSAYRNITSTASITNTGGASVVLRADNTGTGIGTVSFSGGNNVSLSGGSGTVSIYYNPTVFGTQDAIYSGGTAPIQYMLVNSAANLQSINSFLNANFALGTNITLSGNFTPLGTASTPYTGQFDGQQFTISGLSITNVIANTDIGLFGDISGNTIANVQLSNVTISQTADNNGQSTYVGSLVGLSTNGNLLNDSVTNPTITVNGSNFGIAGSRGYYDIGGLIGATFGGAINNSFSSDGTINNNVITNASASNATAFNEVGGFIGGIHNSATMDTDYSSTVVNSNGNETVAGSGATGELLVGGFAGRLDLLSSAANIYSTGAVSVTTIESVPTGSAAYVLVGGLIGVTSIANGSSVLPSLDNVYSTSNVTLHLTITNSAASSAEALLGGLLGQSNAPVENAYSTGAVKATLTTDTSASQETFYVGGFAGDSITSIDNSYSTSPVTVTGINHGNQVSVGGFIGANITLFDREITQSSASGVINSAVNNEDGGQLFIGGFIGLNIYYGDPPPARLPVANDYSTSILNLSGVNDASTTAIGGFIGANGYDGGDPGGNISNSYSTGFVNDNVATINGGTTYAGGFLGQNIPSTDPASEPITLTSNFYDTGTTGFNQNQGIGDTPGAVTGITPGCFGGGSCPNGGSADLSLQATYNTAGWNFASTWGIINTASYPYLLGSNPLPPQIISGSTPASAGTAINLVSDGVIIATTFTGSNGSYYFFEPNGTIASNQLGLVYLSGSTLKGNTIFGPAADGNGSGTSILANTLQIGGNSALTITNSDLAALISGISDTDILFSATSANVVIGTVAHPNITFVTTSPTTYQLDGGLSILPGSTGTITFNGPVVLTADSSVTSNSVVFVSSITGGKNLTLMGQSGDNTFTLNGVLALSNVSIVGDATGNNSLNLVLNTAEDWEITGNNLGSVTGISGVTGAVNFSHIANIQGGTLGNTFTYDNNAIITGTINGTNLTQTNVLSYANESDVLNIDLTGVNFSGLTYNSLAALISNYSNINSLIGNDISSITLTNKTNTVVFLSSNSGYINDPLLFSRFTHLISQSGTDIVNFVAQGIYNLDTHVLTINNVPVTLTGFNYLNFTGNIQFVSQPIPPTPPIPPNPDDITSSSSFISGVLQSSVNNSVNVISDIPQASIQSTIDQSESGLWVCKNQNGSIDIDNSANGHHCDVP